VLSIRRLLPAAGGPALPPSLPRRRNRPLACSRELIRCTSRCRARPVAAASRRSFGSPSASRVRAETFPALLHGRFCRSHPAARRRRAVCGRQPRGPSVAPTLTSRSTSWSAAAAVRRHEPLPLARRHAVLRSSKRCGRRCASWPARSPPPGTRELEAERLRAFREVAPSRGARDQNPLTFDAIALDQMRRNDGMTERAE